MKKAIQITLSVLIVVLAYLLYESISEPIRFEKEKAIRYNATIERLINIRKAQVAFKAKTGKFAGDFDKLLNFVKTDSFEVLNKVNVGWDQDQYTEKEAINLGLLQVSVTKFAVLDSLYGKGYPVDSIQFIPFSGGKKFEMAEGELATASGLKIKVFEAKAHNDIILNGLTRQLVVNLNDSRDKLKQYPGLKVGSLTEATNNAGNWE